VKRLTILTATLASGAVLAAPASADIVKAPHRGFEQAQAQREHE